MAIPQIQPSDTLESGFRSKTNFAIDQIVNGYQFINNPAAPNDPANGQLQLLKSGGGFLTIDLPAYYYTKAQINKLVSPSPYKGTWNPGVYVAGDVIDYNNRIYRASATTTTGDIPGSAAVWVLQGGNPPPLVYYFSNSDVQPIVITNFAATYPQFAAQPMIVVREQRGSVFVWRTDVRPTYDSLLDIMTIDMFQACNGDITFRT